jgi:hypothetical protein
MKTLKLNFTIPEDVAETLRTRVDKRKRSAFVAVALVEKLKALEEEQLKQTLIEGYKAMSDEASETNKEWEAITLESWPD